MAEEQKNKKNIFGSTVLVLVVILSIAISALIVGSVLGSNVFTDTTTTTGTNTNETLSGVSNVTNSTFAILSTYPSATCNLDDVYNSSDGTVITGAGNYTYYTDCTIIFQDDSPFVGEDVNVTYDYESVSLSNSVINVTELTDGFNGFVVGIVPFLGVIGIIIAILWLVSYIGPLFSRKEGIQGFEAE